MRLELFKWKMSPLAMVLGLTFVLQLWLCFFFSFGEIIPRTIDINPVNYKQLQFHFPPQAGYESSYWLGAPGLLNTLTPLSLLAHLPTWWFFTVYYPLCAALALWTFQRFLRLVGFDKVDAIWGGIVYAWQGHLLTNVLPGHINPGLLWVLFPLALHDVIRGIRSRDWFYTALAGGWCGWLVVLSPDRGGLACLLVAAFFIAEAWRYRVAGNKGWARPVGQLLVLVLVSVLVAAPTLQGLVKESIAAVETTPETPAQRFAWSTQWSYPPEDYLSYLVPGVWGWYSGAGSDGYWGRIGRSTEWEQSKQGFRNFMLESLSIGTLATALALLGFGLVVRAWFGKYKWAEAQEVLEKNELTFYARFFAMAFVVCLILAMGKYTPCYEFFYRLPYMDTWRNPLKFMTPGNLCLVFLAAYGWRAMRLGRKEQVGLSFWRVLMLLLGMLLFLAVLTGFLLQVVLGAQGYSSEEVAGMTGNMTKTLFLAWLLLWILHRVLGEGRRLGWWQERKFVNPWLNRLKLFSLEPGQQAIALTLLLAGLNTLQMIWVGRHFIAPFSYHEVYQKNDLITQLQQTNQPVRVKVFQEDPLLNHYLSTLFPYFGIQSIDIPAASRIPADYRAFFQAYAQHPFRLWQIAGVRYLVADGAQLSRLQADPIFQKEAKSIHFFKAEGVSFQSVQLKKISKGQEFTHALVEFSNFAPRASIRSEVRVVAGPEQALQLLAEEPFQPARTVLIATDQIGPVPTGGRGVVEVEHDEKGRIQLKAKLEQPGMVVINDRYEPSWKAKINGASVPLMRADYMMMGFAVPAGESRITLHFQPSFTWVYVSSGVWIFLALAGLWKARIAQVGRARSWPEHSPDPAAKGS